MSTTGPILAPSLRHSGHDPAVSRHRDVVVVLFMGNGGTTPGFGGTALTGMLTATLTGQFCIGFRKNEQYKMRRHLHRHLGGLTKLSTQSHSHDTFRRFTASATAGLSSGNSAMASAVQSYVESACSWRRRI